MLRVVDPTGAVLRHPLLAHRTQIHSAGRPLEEKQRHREAKQAGANCNPYRDRHFMHGAIMPDLNQLRNRFICHLSSILHGRSRRKDRFAVVVGAMVVPHRRGCVAKQDT